jgi:uncharacterized protein (DUF2267 family)
MSAHGLEAIDHTVHLTHEWINDLSDRLNWDSKRDTLRLLRATLRQVRDHLGHEEAAQFAAQLPLLVRGMYYEGWIPARTPIRDRNAERFVQAIGEQVGDVADYRGAEDITAVFQLLDDRISKGEVRDIKAGLPKAICALWPG